MNKHIDSTISSLKTGWYIWLFPAFAIAISGWLLVDYFNQQGPRLLVSFDDASGIQAEKTKVRFRGVSIGTVKDVYISDDQKDVIAEVVLRKDAKRFAVDGSKFSLITPKVGFQGVSGLNTLFEGAYIAVLPGPPTGRSRVEFTGQVNTSTDPLDDTSTYFIETESTESISTGASVTYRGLNIGTVSKLQFAKGGQTINIQINVENRYSWLIRDNTIFWRKVGVQAKLGLFGSDIKINSLESIMSGGVEIATPSPAGPMAKAMHRFVLTSVIPKDANKWKPVLN